jgi:hypothetical protein
VRVREQKREEREIEAKDKKRTPETKEQDTNNKEKKKLKTSLTHFAAFSHLLHSPAHLALQVRQCVFSHTPGCVRNPLRQLLHSLRIHSLRQRQPNQEGKTQHHRVF